MTTRNEIVPQRWKPIQNPSSLLLPSLRYQDSAAIPTRSTKYTNLTNKQKPSSNLLLQIKHNRPPLAKALPLLQPLPPLQELRILFFPLNKPELRLDHIHHSEHSSRRDIRDGQLVAAKEIIITASVSRFHEPINHSDGLMDLAQLPGQPFRGGEIPAGGLEEC